MSEIVNSILSGRLSPLADSGKKLTHQENAHIKSADADEVRPKKVVKDFQRLNSALASDQPLKDNVPRGYYLNILI
jgi:hypothetical protein